MSRRRSRHARDADIRSAPARTESAAPARRGRPPSAPSGVFTPGVDAGRSPAVSGFERARRREKPPIQRQQIGLWHRSFVRHGHTQEDLALAFRIPNRGPSGICLGLPRLTREACPLVQQPDDASIERVDASPEAAELSGLQRLAARALSHARRRGPWRSPRAPGDSRGRPDRRSIGTRCHADS